MSDATKIQKLVDKGYKQAAFSKKSNADFFAHLWEEQGYEVGEIKSSGPTMEEPHKHVLHAHYIVAKKKVRGAKEDITNKVIKKFI